MTPRLLGSALGMLALLSSAPLHAQEDWRLEKDADGIQVHTRAVEGSSHRAIRAHMIVDTPVAELVALVKDTASCAEWAQFCVAARIVERLDTERAYIYTRNDLPWPVADRDALTDVTWHIDSARGAARMEAHATEGIFPKQKGAVRITQAESSWFFEPTADGRTEVTTEAHVNPNGPVPAWITNRLLVEAPYATLERMRELAATGRYAGVPLGATAAR